MKNSLSSSSRSYLLLKMLLIRLLVDILFLLVLFKVSKVLIKYFLAETKVGFQLNIPAPCLYSRKLHISYSEKLYPSNNSVIFCLFIPC